MCVANIVGSVDCVCHLCFLVRPPKVREVRHHENIRPSSTSSLLSDQRFRPPCFQLNFFRFEKTFYRIAKQRYTASCSRQDKSRSRSNNEHIQFAFHDCCACDETTSQWRTNFLTTHIYISISRVKFCASSQKKRKSGFFFCYRVILCYVCVCVRARVETPRVTIKKEIII